MNQRCILAAFQEEDWPERIDDPLPGHRGIDPKRRLIDTIVCLNKGLTHQLIRFHGDGTGTGVIWLASPELHQTFTRPSVAKPKSGA